MSSLGPLPVHVRHYRGETTESYWGRLCRANALTQTDLWRLFAVEGVARDRRLVRG